jgi:hypothetical protein
MQIRCRKTPEFRQPWGNAFRHSFHLHLVNAVVNSSDCVALNGTMVVNWKGWGRKWSWPNLGHISALAWRD